MLHGYPKKDDFFSFLENLEDARARAKSNLEKEKEEVGLLQGEILSTDILYSNVRNKVFLKRDYRKQINQSILIKETRY